MSRQTNIAICFLFVALLATSCSARKKMVKPEPQPQAFEWLTANLDIEAEGNGATQNLKGQLRMRNDSLVWLNVTATMGMEVLRAKVSKDSVWIINRLDKTYLADPLDTVAAQLGVPVSLPWVQTMLLDNNEGLPPVENQTVLLKTVLMGGLSAKVKYTNIKLNEKTTFPLKITDKMQRVRLKKQQ